MHIGELVLVVFGFVAVVLALEPLARDHRERQEQREREARPNLRIVRGDR